MQLKGFLSLAVLLSFLISQETRADDKLIGGHVGHFGHPFKLPKLHRSPLAFGGASFLKTNKVEKAPSPFLPKEGAVEGDTRVDSLDVAPKDPDLPSIGGGVSTGTPITGGLYSRAFGTNVLEDETLDSQLNLDV